MNGRRAQHRKYQRQSPPPLLNVITLQTAQPLFMLDVYKGIFSYASVNLWTMYIFRSFWTMPNFRNEEGVEWNKASNQNEHFNYLKKKEKDKLRSIIFCFFLFSISTLWDRFYNEPTASSSSQSSLILFFSITFCFVFLWKSRLAFYVEGWRFVVCPRARARSPSNTQKEKHWIGWMDFFILLVTAFSFGEWPSWSLWMITSWEEFYTFLVLLTIFIK